MPSLSYNTLKNIKDNILYYPIFVETGSFRGETIFQMEKYFQSLHTIEIKKSFYDNLIKKYNGNKISFYLGDSSIVLKDVMKKINKPTIFFLDGHYSAGNTGKGEKHVPLYEEIAIINKLCKQKCIIIIDDFRLFGVGPNNTNTLCNWESINKPHILNLLKNRISSNYHLPSTLNSEDRFIIHLNSQ